MSIIDNVADIAAEVKRLRAEQAKPDQPSDAKPPTDPLEAMRQHLRELYGWDFGDGALDLMCGVPQPIVEWTKIKDADTDRGFGWCDLYNLPY